MAKYELAYPSYCKMTITQDDNGKDIETLADKGSVIGKAVNANINIATRKNVLWADNHEDIVIDEFQSGNLTLAVNDLSLETEADLLGKETNDDGAILSSGGDEPPYIRFGFVRGGWRSKTKYYRGIVYMKVVFGPGGTETFNTKNENSPLDPDSITGTLQLNKDKNYKMEKQFETEEAAHEFINTMLNITEDGGQ